MILEMKLLKRSKKTSKTDLNKEDLTWMTLILVIRNLKDLEKDLINETKYQINDWFETIFFNIFIFDGNLFNIHYNKYI